MGLQCTIHILRHCCPFYRLNPPIDPSLLEDPELSLDLGLAHGEVDVVEGHDDVEDVRAADGGHVHQDLGAGVGGRHRVVRHRLQAVLRVIGGFRLGCLLLFWIGWGVLYKKLHFET